MDSMDWFTPPTPSTTTTTDPTPAQTQIRALYTALKPGGRVLLRSAGLEPWYIQTFKEEGFVARRVNSRREGIVGAGRGRKSSVNGVVSGGSGSGNGFEGEARCCDRYVFFFLLFFFSSLFPLPSV